MTAPTSPAATTARKALAALRGLGSGVVTVCGATAVAALVEPARRGRAIGALGLASAAPQFILVPIRNEPAAAKAARNRATMSHRALRRPKDWARTPMTGGPARLAK